MITDCPAKNTTHSGLDGCTRCTTQRSGVDYDDTYAPVADFETVLTVIASLVADGVHVHQADIATAFLYGSIDEEI